MPVTVTLRAEIDKGRRTVPEVQSASWCVAGAYIVLADGREYGLRISEADEREIEKQLAEEGAALAREVLAQKPEWMEVNHD